LLIPSLLFNILPITFFITALVVMHKLILDKEILGLRSIGISNAEIYKPFAVMCLFVMLFCYFLSSYVIPTTQHNLSKTRQAFREQSAYLIFDEKVFNTQTRGLTIYIEKLAAPNHFTGIFIHDARNPAKQIFISAREALYNTQGQSMVFEFYNGTVYEQYTNGERSNLMHFDNYTLNVSMPYSNPHYDANPNAMPILEAMRAIRTMPNNIAPKFTAQLHYRITWPLYTVAFMVLVLCILRKDSVLIYSHEKSFVWIILIGILMVLLSIMAQSMILYSGTLILVAYLIPSLGIIMPWYLCIRK
jgi:lipopolysaccharide export system permease protein